jgi:hypothetical protein
MATWTGFFFAPSPPPKACTLKFIESADELRAAIASDQPAHVCSCALGSCAGWESLAEYRWPQQQMTAVGTLRDVEQYEPSFEEYHPQGTRYDSPDAPVAVKFFPYNRCEVWHCSQCQRHLLRYTEFGGYNVDHRVRMLTPDKIVD